MPRQGLAPLPDLDRTQEPGFSSPQVSIHTDAVTLAHHVGDVIRKTTGDCRLQRCNEQYLCVRLICLDRRLRVHALHHRCRIPGHAIGRGNVCVRTKSHAALGTASRPLAGLYAACAAATRVTASAEFPRPEQGVKPNFTFGPYGKSNLNASASPVLVASTKAACFIGGANGEAFTCAESRLPLTGPTPSSPSKN